jgi:IS30 family transposase
MPQVKITKSSLQRIIQEELNTMMGEGDPAAPVPDAGGGSPELAELEKLLQTHDWTYEYSDDYRSWSRGSQENDRINAKVREIGAKDKMLGDKALEMLRSYAKKRLGR